MFAGSFNAQAVVYPRDSANLSSPFFIGLLVFIFLASTNTRSPMVKRGASSRFSLA